MITSFEAYLLSQMRALSLVSAVLRSVGCSPEECVEKAHSAKERWSLNQPHHSADIYREAIGNPILEQSLKSDDISQCFVGSVRRLFYLPLWPKVLFQVNEHPSGYAWGEGFVQETFPISPPELSTIKPWEWVVSKIEPVASQVEILEHWDHEKDIRLIFEQGGQSLTYVAKFDFNLLQKWEQTSE